MMHEFKDTPSYVAEVAGAVRAVVDRATEFEDATDRLCEVVETTAPADFDGHHEPFLTTKLEDAQDACRRGLSGVSEAMGALDPSLVRTVAGCEGGAARCCICGAEIASPKGTTIGQNKPWPISEDFEESGPVCCGDCDSAYVTPARSMMKNLDSDGLLDMAARMADLDCTSDAIHGVLTLALEVRERAMHAEAKKGAEPTPLALATLRFHDELSQVMDDVIGVAYLLGTHADGRDCDGERHAVNMLSTTLFDCAERVRATLDVIESMRSEGGVH